MRESTTLLFQGLGALRGKINLDYDASPDPWKRHKGLYIHSPTIEMSGDYTCKISTLENEVSKTKRMTVYGESFHDLFNSIDVGFGPELLGFLHGVQELIFDRSVIRSIKTVLFILSCHNFYNRNILYIY